MVREDHFGGDPDDGDKKVEKAPPLRLKPEQMVKDQVSKKPYKGGKTRRV